MAFIASTSLEGLSNTPSVPVPSGAQAGDDVVLVCTRDAASENYATSKPADFDTRDIASLTPDGQQVFVGHKKLTAEDTGSYTFGVQPDAWYWVCQAFLFRGRHETNPIPTDGITVAELNSPVSSPLSIIASGVTAEDGDDLLWLAAPDTTSPTTGVFDPPSGFTEREDAHAESWANLSGATKDAVTAGATGDVTGTFTASGVSAGYVAYLIRLRQADGGASVDTAVSAPDAGSPLVALQFVGSASGATSYPDSGSPSAAMQFVLSGASHASSSDCGALALSIDLRAIPDSITSSPSSSGSTVAIDFAALLSSQKSETDAGQPPLFCDFALSPDSISAEAISGGPEPIPAGVIFVDLDGAASVPDAGGTSPALQFATNPESISSSAFSDAADALIQYQNIIGDGVAAGHAGSVSASINFYAIPDGSVSVPDSGNTEAEISGSDLVMDGMTSISDSGVPFVTINYAVIGGEAVSQAVETGPTVVIGEQVLYLALCRVQATAYIKTSVKLTEYIRQIITIEPC